ncbi:MAG: nucleoside triphosphate pyrophosphohydrolase [Bdellovibrionales bacterium]
MTSNVKRLLDIMARLRSRDGGCPWDLEQTFKTVAPHTLEETYELVDAIERGDPEAIQDELGDVLFQIVFHAQMGKEAGLFDFDSVAGHVADKMIERHPHVFGERDVKTAEGVASNWEKDKEAKRSAKAGKEGRTLSVLDGISSGLPATTHSVKLQKRAAHVGFDWPNARDVFAKIREEIGELEKEVSDNKDKAFLVDELGDVLFAVTNLARKLNIDPEMALRSTNRKFERRFRGIEEALAKQDKNIADVSLDEMERLWNEIKRQEKSSRPIK